MTTPERPEGREADPRMAEFERLVRTFGDLEYDAGYWHGTDDAPNDHKRATARATLRAFFAAQLAEPDAQWRIVMQAQADTIADLSAQLAERPEPIGNATVVTQASGPMAGNLGEYTDLRIGQIIPRGIYALTLVGEP